MVLLEIIMEEEAVLEEMTEILKLMVIEINLIIIFLITNLFKEKHQEETTIMLQN